MAFLQAMEVHRKLGDMMKEWDIASGKCSTERIYSESAYIPDLAYLVHALIPEVSLIFKVTVGCWSDKVAILQLQLRFTHTAWFMTTVMSS